MKEFINKLCAIFDNHKNERICVLAATCCGKTSLLKQFPGCIDLDDELYPLLTQEEIKFINQKPWTDKIGNFIDKLVREKISVKVGHPLFTTVVIDCDVIVYLDINDELLAKHCKERGVQFLDAKNMKNSIEKDLNSYNKTFYRLIVTE